MGARYSVDMRTGRKVDLLALGKKLGVTVIEVRDPWQAFELLTGKRLPAPAAVDDAAMTTTSQQRTLLSERYATRLRWVQTGRQKMTTAPAELRSSSLAMLAEAERARTAVGTVPAAARWYFELAEARAKGDDRAHRARSLLDVDGALGRRLLAREAMTQRWRRHTGIEPARVVSHPPHRF